jgi:hypothetical protein
MGNSVQYIPGIKCASSNFCLAQDEPEGADLLDTATLSLGVSPGERRGVSRICGIAGRQGRAGGTLGREALDDKGKRVGDGLELRIVGDTNFL